MSMLILPGSLWLMRKDAEWAKGLGGGGRDFPHRTEAGGVGRGRRYTAARIMALDCD